VIEREVRTRFAPSPTGYLHLGNARIALINYIVALKHKGRFFLRIEDTDVDRSSAEYVSAIEEDLLWLGVRWDKKVIFQSKRVHLYREKAFELWERGFVYPCFCTPDELKVYKDECIRKGKPPRYSGKCRGLSKEEVKARITNGEPFSFRLKIDHKLEVKWDDLIKGKKRFKGKNLDDIIIFRSDGTPTYHLASVVDDIEAGITYIIRGEDHLANTPYHILLFKAFEYPCPFFAHVPLVKAPKGEVLEKRKESPWSLRRLREDGYLPLAVVNFIITLGWNPPHKGFLGWREIVETFSLSDLSSSSVTFSPSALKALNKKLLLSMDVEELKDIMRSYVCFDLPEERIKNAIFIVRENASTLIELGLWLKRLFLGPETIEFSSYEKELLKKVLHAKERSLEEAVEKLASTLDKKEKSMLYQALRKALLGVPHGPPLKDIVGFLKDEAKVRLENLCFQLGI